MFQLKTECLQLRYKRSAFTKTRAADPYLLTLFLSDWTETAKIVGDQTLQDGDAHPADDVIGKQVAHEQLRAGAAAEEATPHSEWLLAPSSGGERGLISTLSFYDSQKVKA